MYEFWCGVILRDVRGAILTTHQNSYIYFHMQPITFLLHTRYYQKSLKIYYIFFMNKISKITSISNKQKLKFKTKVNQLLSLPFLRLSRNMNAYSKEFHSYFESTCTFSFVIFIFKKMFWDKMLNVEEFQ